MTTSTPSRTLAAGALLLAAACATSAPAPAARDAARPRDVTADLPAPAAAAPQEEISARAQRLFKEALKTLEDQRDLKVPIDWELMEKKWRAVVSAEPVAEAHFNLGVAVDAQGREQEARAEYERALALKPSLRQARVNLAVLEERKGDARGAAAAYGEILRDHPEDSMARERLAALYLESGQYDDAWRLAREALLRDPRAIGAYKTMLRVSMHRKDHDIARLIALRAQKLDDRDAEITFRLGQVLALQGDEAGAAAQWAKTLELAPGHLPARYALLEQAVRKEAWPRVSEQAGAILAEDPKNPRVVLLRGIALRHSGKVEEALEAYDAAERLADGTLPEVYLARGVLLMRDQGECEPALAQFDRYARAAGPILPKGSPVPALQRECDEQLAANKAALEAAKQMQLEAEKAAAAEAARGAAEAAPPPQPGGK